MALQVYLDSQDYSNLSGAMADKGGNQHRGIFDELMRLVESNAIEIRYSAVHVIEVCHLDDRYKDAGVRRAECIKSLSVGKCFRFSTELQYAECLSYLSKKPMNQRVTSDSNEWYPDLRDIVASFRDTFLLEAEKILSEQGINRQRRRALLRKLFPRGYASDSAIDLLKPNRQQFLADLTRKFPMSRRLIEEDLLLEFAKGTVDAKVVVDEMAYIFKDIPTFVGWTYGTKDEEKKLIGWLRGHGTDVVEAIEDVRSEISTLTPEQRSALFDSRRLLDALRERGVRHRVRTITSCRELYAKRNATKKYKDKDWHNLENSQKGELPSLDAYIDAMVEHFYRSLQMTRRLKPSDGADVHHAAHIPYCDIFRADGDSSQMVKSIAQRHGVVVVPKLKDLIPMIHSRLS